MKKIPGARDVDRAFQNLLRSTKNALKGLNQTAGKSMAKGDYASAESLAQKGREIDAFRADVEALRTRWKQLGGVGPSSGDRRPKTRLWEYYQPILKALVELGGEASKDQIQEAVERIMKADFKPGDGDLLGRAEKRWQVMIRRSRRRLVAEGWLEPGSAKMWRITSAGRKAASAKIKPQTG